MRLPLALSMIVPLAACATVTSPPRADGSAALHQTTQAGPLRVRPERVVEDSRCPMNARCIRAGRVVVEATVWDAGHAQSRSLILGETALTAAGELMLDSVEPSTQTGTAIAPGDYRFHFSYRDAR